MSDAVKEPELDSGPSATAVTTGLAVVDQDPNASPGTSKLDEENGTVEEDAITSAKPTDSGKEKIESGLQVGDMDDIKSLGDSKKTLNGQKDGKKYAHPKRQNKSKYDASKQPVPDDAAARAQSIRNLVHFYFSNSNLYTDDYLLGQIDGIKNLPVKISLVHKFGRMRKFDYADIVDALRDSDFLEVTGPDGLQEVRRRVPYDPNKKHDWQPRTVYVKGFGEELPTTQFDIEAFFAQFGPTNSVRLRRTDDEKLFKGSCYIEFQDEKTAQSFLDLEPKPLWQGKHELEIMSHLDYIKKKNQSIGDGEQEPNAMRAPRGRGKGGRGGSYRGNRDGRDRGDRDPDDWKKRRDEDQKSGFRDNRRDRDNRSSNNNRGRIRGKGNDKDRRNNDRNRGHDDRDRVKPDDRSDEELEKMGDDTSVSPEKKEPSKKRGREDDSLEEMPSKKLDQKEEVNADAS